MMAIHSENDQNIILLCPCDTMSAGGKEKVETNKS